MRSKLTTLLTTVLALTVPAGQALSASVCGTAQNAQGTPLSGATITIKDVSGKLLGQTVTGDNGAYSVGNLPQGSLDLYLTPGGPGAQAGSGILDLTGESEKVNWQVSDASGAVASQNGPCADPPGPLTPVEWASIGVLGLGVGAGVAAIVWAETGNRSDHKKPFSPTL